MKSETTEYKICHTKKNDSKIQKNFLTQSCIEFLEKNVNKSSSTIQSYAEKYSNYISRKKSKDLSVASDDFYTNLNTLFPELFTIPFPNPEKPDFTYIDLFSGIGGFHLAMHQLNGKCVLSSEIDKYAIDTYLDNYGINSNHDITKIRDEDFPKHNVLCGGFPCQAFSKAGKQLGFADQTKGTLFFQIVRILKNEKVRPEYIILENVRNLLSHDKGNTFKIICDIFCEQGYNIEYKVLNALDYGVAQKRERLIVVGIRKDLQDKVFFTFPKKHDKKLVLRDILQNVPKSQCAKYSEQKAAVFALVPAGGYWRDIDPNIAKAYMKTCWNMAGGRTGILRRLSFDEPSLTVLTTPQMKQTDRCHPSEIRPFSVRENARIQSFPDEWEFCGSMAEQYKQIGNAVPVNLAYEIGKEIIKSLNGETKWGESLF